MPQRQLDQLPDLSQLALAAPDVVVTNLVKALIVVTLGNKNQNGEKKNQNGEKRHENGREGVNIDT